jgi:thiamine-phosphate pyrophosphorylase
VIPPLYIILDADVAGRHGWSVLRLTEACLAGGARLFQLRAKTMASGELAELGRSVVSTARRAGGRVIVNDRADVARLVEADGVHVGHTDLDPASARAVVGPDAIVGVSTHTRGQWTIAASAPVDYIAVGPVFGTATKATGYEPIGLATVTQAAAEVRASGKPLVAIGGITLETAAGVLRAGAGAVAVISDVFSGGDPEGRVRAYIETLTV